MRSLHYPLYREESDYGVQRLDYDVVNFGSTGFMAIFTNRRVEFVSIRGSYGKTEMRPT